MGAGWLALHLWIVPRIGDFRPALEQLATRTIGMQVRIGALEARSTGWAPSFELRDIRLFDPQNLPALSLPGGDRHQRAIGAAPGAGTTGA